MDTLEMAVQSRLSKSAALAESEREAGAPLDVTVESVTKCLERIPLLPKAKATLECLRAYHAFGMKKFRAALSDASAADVDAFGEALDGAAHLFTTKQQDQITSWTGLTISAAPREEDAEQDQLEAELEKKLARLEQDLGGMVKKEADEVAHRAGARTRPDWTGRPAPATPGTALMGRQAGVGFQGKGKGKGKSVLRSFGGGGIASLADAARLHGLSTQQYHSGQLMAFSDAELQLKEEQAGEGAGAKRKAGFAATPAPVRFKKGAPTVAPLTPMPTKKKNGTDI